MSMAEVKFALDTSFIRRVNKNLQEKGGGEGGGGKERKGSGSGLLAQQFSSQSIHVLTKLRKLTVSD